MIYWSSLESELSDDLSGTLQREIISELEIISDRKTL